MRLLDMRSSDGGCLGHAAGGIWNNRTGQGLASALWKWAYLSTVGLRLRLDVQFAVQPAQQVETRVCLIRTYIVLAVAPGGSIEQLPLYGRHCYSSYRALDCFVVLHSTQLLGALAGVKSSSQVFMR